MWNEGGDLSGKPLANVAQEILATGEIRVSRGNADPDSWDVTAPLPARAAT
jgi:hypothetical protein